ncbi:MAG: DMT family transporter [Bacteroidales bacterium]|nr:DMT family transporter [Bacteroidales bacterium]
MEFGTHTGEFAALLTTVFWTITALSFETASKKIGSLHLNLLRLAVALVLLAVFSYIYRSMPFPLDAGYHQWVWLSLSGIIGFVIGDYCLFKSFILIGARVSMLVMTLAPILAALVGWIFLSDTISYLEMAGMALTMAGIAMVIFVRVPSEGTGKVKQMKLALPLQGIVLAVIAAAGQGIGLVISKYGMKNYDPFSSAQIRVFAGFIGFALLFTILRKWNEVPASIRNRKAMLWLVIGSIFGPFLGVSFSMIAVQHTNAGIAQTIMSLVPIIIIPPAIMITGVWPKMREIIGALLAVAGVSLFFI